MKNGINFLLKLIFSVSLFAVQFGACRSSFAASVMPGDFFDISYDMTTVPVTFFNTPPYTRAIWFLYFFGSGTINVSVYDSSDMFLGTEDVALFYGPDEGELFWATPHDPSFDPYGYVRFTSINATIEVDLARSYVVMGNDFVLAGSPIPPALPLFASGLGVFSLFAWRRKRKANFAA